LELEEDVRFIAEKLGFKVEWCERLKIGDDEFFKMFLLKDGGKYVAKAFFREVDEIDVKTLLSELYEDIRGMIFAFEGCTKEALACANSNGVKVYDREYIANRLNIKKLLGELKIYTDLHMALLEVADNLKRGFKEI